MSWKSILFALEPPPPFHSAGPYRLTTLFDVLLYIAIGHVQLRSNHKQLIQNNNSDQKIEANDPLKLLTISAWRTDGTYSNDGPCREDRIKHPIANGGLKHFLD